MNSFFVHHVHTHLSETRDEIPTLNRRLRVLSLHSEVREVYKNIIEKQPRTV